MTRTLALAGGAALLAVAGLLWSRYGLAVVLADPGWLCLPG